LTFFNIFFNNLFEHENISHIFATKFHAKQACNQHVSPGLTQKLFNHFINNT